MISPRPRLNRPALFKRILGVAALAIVAATCKDLTGPTGIATDGSTVTVTYMGPVDANGVVQLTVGDRVSPPVEVRIGTTIATRARYVFSTSDTSVLTVSGGGDTLIATGRGRDTIVVTLVGATIGGKFDPNVIHMRDTVLVAVKPARNLVSTSPIPVLRSFGETATMTAESQDINNQRTRAGKVRWYSANPAVFTVDSAGTANADGTNTTLVTAVSNGQAVNLITVFDDVDTVRTPMTVQQILGRIQLTSRFGPGNQVDFQSLGDTATVRAIPQDARGNPLAAGAVPPGTSTFAIAPLGRVTLNTTTGLLTANLNTDLGSPALVTATNGTVTSLQLPVSVQQVATSIAIIGKRVDTIPSIGSTKDLIAIVKDARGNDVQSGITWTSRNTAVVQFRTGSTGDVALAIDTGTTRFVVSRDQVADSITITVTNNPETVVLQPDTLFIRSISEIKRFTALTVKNAKGDALVNIPITWTSADPTIVQANADSTMVAQAVGATNVTARTPNGKTATSRVVVTNAPAFLDILPANATLASVGDTLLNIAVDFRNGLGAAVPRSAASWSSSDVNVASVAVDPSGNVRIIAAGTGNAYIRAVSPVDALVRDSVFVTVTNAPASIVAAPSPAPTMAAFGSTITFTATVFNASGNPIPTAKLRWSMPAGGAFVSIDSVTGVATALANGSATVRATSSGITVDIPVTVAQAIAGTRSTITPGVASLVADGASSTTITVQLKDANDNNIAFGGSSVVLTTSLGTLSPLPPTDVGNGRYTTTLTTGSTGGSASITGTVAGNAITNNAIVSFTAGAATRYIATANNSTPTAGTAVTIRAQLADNNNNPIATSGTVVQFTSTNGGSFTPVNGQATTDVAGVATITFNTNQTVSAHTVTATTGGITGSTAAINSIAGAAQNYFVVPSGTSPVAGSVITLSAQLRDQFNNNVASQNQTVNWSHSGAGAFPGGATDNSLTNAAGVASITFTTSTASAATSTVTATTGGVTGTSVNFTTVPGAASPATTLITSNVASVTAGGTATITVQARDVNSNLLTASGGTVVLATTLGTLSTVVDNANGTYTATLSTSSAGTATITGTINGLAIADNEVVTVNVTGGTPSAAQTIATVPPGTAGTQTSIAIQARDAFGNNLTASAATVQVTVSGANTVAQFTATNNGNGTYTALYTPTVAGTDAIAIVLGGTPIAGSPYSSVVGAGAHANFLVESAGGGPIGTQSAAAPFNIRFTARDASGNTITTFGGTADLTSTGAIAGGAFTTGAFANGVLTTSLAITNTGSFTVTATRSGGGPAGTSNAFTVAAGAASPATTTIAAVSPVTAGGTSTITVTARDANSNPLATSGGTVTLATNLGSLSAVTNNSNGTYSATLSTTVTGTATISGTINGAPITSGNATVVVTLGTPSTATSTITAAPPSITATGATTSAVTVQLKDDQGNNITIGGATVTLTRTGTGTLGSTASGNGLVTVTADDQGNGTYTATLTSPSSTGSATINGTLGGSPITDNAVVTFTPGAATHYQVTPAGTSVAAGSTVLVTAQLRDVNNNDVATSGKTVGWTSNTNGGAFAGGAQFPTTQSNTDAGGAAVIAFTVSTTAGSVHQVRGTDNTALTGTSGNITVVAAAATQLVILVQPTDAVAGASIAPAIQVSVRDQFGNTVTADNTTQVTLALGANPGGGTLSGTTTLTVTNGVASFGNLSIDKTGTGYTLVASSTPALAGATSATFDIDPGLPTQLVFTGQPTNTTAGQSIAPAVAVTVRDALGNTVTTDNSTDVTIAIANNAGGGTLSGTLIVTAVNGIASFGDLSIDKSGVGYTLSVTSNPALGTATSSAFTVDPGPASTAAGGSTVAAAPTTVSILATQTSNITVQLRDVFGNNRTTNDGTVTLELDVTSLGAGTFSAVTYAGNGSYTATFTPTLIGTAVVRARLDGVLLTNSVTITVTP